MGVFGGILACNVYKRRDFQSNHGSAMPSVYGDHQTDMSCTFEPMEVHPKPRYNGSACPDTPNIHDDSRFGSITIKSSVSSLCKQPFEPAYLVFDWWFLWDAMVHCGGFDILIPGIRLLSLSCSSVLGGCVGLNIGY